MILIRKPVKQVVPTYVGVILYSFQEDKQYGSGPHVCGGDPRMPMITGFFSWWSPRMWG